MSDTTIYILTHRDFKKPRLQNPSYKILDSRTFEVPTLKYDDSYYSELYHMYYLRHYKRDELSEYVGFCHYRRYFSFGDNIPQIDKNQVVLLKPILQPYTNRTMYGVYHNIEDIEIVERIITNEFREYQGALSMFLASREISPCNMFIMHRDKFCEMVDFIFGVIKRFEEEVGDIDERLEKNKDKYIKNFHPNNTLAYQKRICGYLLERLVCLFVLKHFGKKDKIYTNMILTEGKY